MNYIQQIRAFDDFKLYKARLSAGQIALWHALMSINNKTSWQEWFTAANVTLESLSGLSRSGILKNRNILKQLELIDFKTNGRKATSYHVCTLYTSDSKHESNQSSKHSSTQDSTHTSKHESNTLTKHKLNETKQYEEGTVSPNSFETWENLWGFPNAIVQQDFEHWRADFSEDMIIYAITEAGKRDVQSKGADRYIDKVLDGWKERKITTIEQAKEAAAKHQELMKSQYSKPNWRQRTPVQKETLPDWAKSDYEVTDTMADAKTQQEFNERLAKLRSKRSS
ncbi:DnaD domain protein [Pediococcus ethanolidurans]|uniref:DnaD and phage-associated domain-containing protein n=1 Tax=Pediococcus ethanolidurans TaxID=319653 RepID=A0A0R2K0I0_9LACO|nr:DnaD domain protein [Pediococcus ethanolidurans]KRN82875.1 DnaD domain protein [Pediococcus ethanolidurans]GEN94713.1 DNA damage-inducible protein DnaD [Pediococcus ethanolidurans]SER18378.1 DnaD and phage-associated domain-containing protein [Pediococcus ethanolidurans]